MVPPAEAKKLGLIKVTSKNEEEKNGSKDLKDKKAVGAKDKEEKKEKSVVGKEKGKEN